jgi:hypothetical protein
LARGNKKCYTKEKSMQEIKIKEKQGIIGRIIVRQHQAGVIERFMFSLMTPQEVYEARMDTAKRGGPFIPQQKYIKDPERWKMMIKLFRSGTVAAKCENTIMQGINTGKDLIVSWLNGQMATGQPAAAYQNGINYGAIGSSSTAPTTADTQLGTETNRTIPSFFEDQNNNEASIQFFFPDGILANGTYPEFGTFVNGTASANSGAIFNHALFAVAYVKASGTDTTVEVDITLT